MIRESETGSNDSSVRLLMSQDDADEPQRAVEERRGGWVGAVHNLSGHACASFCRTAHGMDSSCMCIMTDCMAARWL